MSDKTRFFFFVFNVFFESFHFMNFKARKTRNTPVSILSFTKILFPDNFLQPVALFRRRKYKQSKVNDV